MNLTLADKASVVADLAAKLPEVEKLKGEINTISKVREYLQEKIDTIAPLTSNITLYQHAGLIQGRPRVPKLEKLIQLVQSQRAQIADDPLKVTAKFNRARFDGIFDAANKELSELRDQAWNKFARGEMEKLLLSDGDLEAALVLPEKAAVVCRLQQIKDECDRQGTAAATTKQAIDRLLSLVAEGTQLEQQIEQLPPAVKTFLKEARTSGAPLSLLTDEVQAWLKLNPETAQRIKIRVGG